MALKIHTRGLIFNIEKRVDKNGFEYAIFVIAVSSVKMDKHGKPTSKLDDICYINAVTFGDLANMVLNATPNYFEANLTIIAETKVENDDVYDSYKVVSIKPIIVSDDLREFYSNIDDGSKQYIIEIDRRLKLGEKFNDIIETLNKNIDI